jgi:hypothetical protein
MPKLGLEKVLSRCTEGRVAGSQIFGQKQMSRKIEAEWSLKGK